MPAQAMTDIVYPFDRTVPDDSPMPVHPDIFWMRMPLPFVLNHVNIWLIREPNGWCTIDSGVTWNTGKNVWRRHLDAFPLVRQIATHYHPDHMGLAGWLESETGAPLWVTRSEYLTALAYQNGLAGYSVEAMLQFFETHGLGEAIVSELKSRGNGYAKGCPMLPNTYECIHDGDEITIGENTWHVMTGSGHGVEHASLFCESQRILVAGDMLLPSISTNIPVRACNPNGDPLSEFLHSISRFEPLPADTLVLPSHGRPYRGLHARIRFIRAYHQARCQTVLEACSTPRAASDIMPILFTKPMVDAHQYVFGIGESIAYLNHLEKKHLLTRCLINGRWHFART